MITVRRAEREDAETVAALVREAFGREARRYGVEELPPMRETAEMVAELMADHVVLLAEEDGRAIGTVRGHAHDGVCDVGRLAVATGHEGRGVGQRLLREIELACPAPRFALFTGSISDGPLHLYRKLGYTETGRERINEHVELVHLAKTAEDVG